MGEGECDFCGQFWSIRSGGLVDGACPVCRERYVIDEGLESDLERMLAGDGAGLGAC